MALVVTQEGASLCWDYILGAAGAGYPVLHLIGAPHTVVHGDTLASLAAVELVVSGYAPIPLSPSSGWTIVTISNGAKASYPQVFWSFGGLCTVYGAYYTNLGGSISLWGDNFTDNGPYNYPSTGGLFYFTPIYTLTSLP